jgi:hypothetical protein
MPARAVVATMWRLDQSRRSDGRLRDCNCDRVQAMAISLRAVSAEKTGGRSKWRLNPSGLNRRPDGGFVQSRYRKHLGLSFHALGQRFPARCTG